MKAEHRKELETNALADRMGRMVQGVKGAPQRKIALYVILAVIVIAAVYLFINSRRVAREDNSLRWRWLEDGSLQLVQELIKNDPQTNQGKAARFHFAWIFVWDEGLKMMGHAPNEALKRMESAEAFYKELADDCKDDPVLMPEALYSLAVIEETRAIRKREHLDSAAAMYKELGEKFPDSAYGRMAKTRGDLLSDSEKSKDIRIFYQSMQQTLRVDEKMPVFAPPPPLPPVKGPDEKGPEIKPPPLPEKK